MLVPKQFGCAPIFIGQAEPDRPAEGIYYYIPDQTPILSQFIRKEPTIVVVDQPYPFEGWWTAPQPRLLEPGQLHAPPAIIAQAEPPRPGDGSWFMTETYPLVPAQFGSEPVFVAQAEPPRPAEGAWFATASRTKNQTQFGAASVLVAQGEFPRPPIGEGSYFATSGKFVATGWTHIQGTGAQASSGSNATLTSTFPGAVAAGDLIVVSAVWYANYPSTPTVADSVNGVNYTYVGPPVVSNTDNLGTWHYVNPVQALPGTFAITLTTPGDSYLAMTIDEFNYSNAILYQVNSSGTTTQAQGTSISLASALTVTGSDLIYASASLNGAGAASPGSGFTLAYSATIIPGQSYGLAAEYLLNDVGNINPTMSCSDFALDNFNGIAFKAITPGPVPFPAPPLIVQAEPPRPAEGSYFAVQPRRLNPAQFGSEPIFVSQAEPPRPGEGSGFATASRALVTVLPSRPLPATVAQAEPPQPGEGSGIAAQPRPLNPAQFGRTPVFVAQAEPPQPGEGLAFAAASRTLVPGQIYSPPAITVAQAEPPRPGEGLAFAAAARKLAAVQIYSPPAITVTQAEPPRPGEGSWFTVQSRPLIAKQFGAAPIIVAQAEPPRPGEGSWFIFAHQHLSSTQLRYVPPIIVQAEPPRPGEGSWFAVQSRPLVPKQFGAEPIIVAQAEPPRPGEGSAWTAKGRWYQVPGTQWPTIVTAQAQPPYPAMREPTLTVWAESQNPFVFTPLFLPGEFTAVLLPSALDTDPFGIDPEQTTPIAGALDTDPFGIDPEQTTIITTGLDNGP